MVIESDTEVYDTFEAAVAAQVLCEPCGRPKRTLVGRYLHGEPTVYFFEDCDKVACRIHCKCP